MNKRRALLLAAGAALATLAAAQPTDKPGGVYPSRPLRLLAPPADGLTRAIAGLLARELAQALGQPVIVDDRANGAALAFDLAASATPGGYSLFLMGPAALFEHAPPKRSTVVKHFVPVSLIVRSTSRDATHDWSGLFAPADTPRNIVTHLHEHAAHILTRPQVKQHLVELDAEPVGSSPENFLRFIEAETRRRTSAAPRS